MGSSGPTWKDDEGTDNLRHRTRGHVGRPIIGISRPTNQSESNRADTRRRSRENLRVLDERP